jgi:cytidine deaminase
MTDATELNPEDAKLVTLARSAQLRAYAPYTGAAQGAAVRDTDGRTYAAATVENTNSALTVSALHAAVIAAAASGARSFEAVAVVASSGSSRRPSTARCSWSSAPTPSSCSPRRTARCSGVRRPSSSRASYDRRRGAG